MSGMQASMTLPSSPTAEQCQVEFATQALPQLEQLSRGHAGPWPLRVMRSSQLDAQRLDAELQTMLHEQFMTVFQLLPQGHVTSLEPELNLVLAALVFWLSVWRGRATPGSELLNLRYRDEHAMERAAAAAVGMDNACGALKQQLPTWLHGGRTGVEGPGLSQQQRCAYALGFVALPYMWLRVHRFAASRGWGQQQDDDRAGHTCLRVLRAVDAAHKLCMVVNLWVFLYQGKYRTLVERLIGARLVYRQPSMSRLISLEYLNRQLVWQELSEFLLFLLPLINVAKVRRAVLRLLPKLPMLTAAGSSGNPAGAPGGGLYPVAAVKQTPSPPATGQGTDLTVDLAASQQQQHQHSQQPQQQSHLPGQSSAVQGCVGSAGDSGSSIAELLHPVGPCPICSSGEILLPFVAHPCRHIFCYYCLQSHCAADSDFQCPVDGVRVESLQRYVRSLPPALS